MQTLLQKRKDDRGFTLIELMVVVLIIGILLSIAIPSFFGARTTAQDTAAKATLRNALTAAKVWYVQNDGKYDDFETNASTIEPSLPWDDINVTSAANSAITMTIASQSGKTCTIEDTGSVVNLDCA